MRTLLLSLLVLGLVFTIAVAAFAPSVFAGDGTSYEDPCEPDGLAAERPAGESAQEDPGPPNCLH